MGHILTLLLPLQNYCSLCRNVGQRHKRGFSFCETTPVFLSDVSLIHHSTLAFPDPLNILPAAASVAPAFSQGRQQGTPAPVVTNQGHDLIHLGLFIACAQG